MPTLNSTAQAMAGGIKGGTATGADTLFAFTGVWATGDTYTVVLTDNKTGNQTQIGAGFITGLNPAPSYALTFNNKVYILAGPTTYFSGVNTPQTFNDPNASGNGNVTMSNWYANPENLVAMAPYQGRLVFFTRRTTLIWQVASDPTQWNLTQTLSNIGTFAPLSVQPIGDLDVMFLSDTGVRSLRVRDSSLNAFVNDVGSPIDALITAALISGAGNTTACAVCEPSSNRYWLYLNGTIYVLSQFPSSKIVAWSTYLPTVQGVTFTPHKFVIFNGQVYALADDGQGDTIVVQYGGGDNNTYDNCPATLQVPFLDGKTPGTNKSCRGIDMVMQGSWTVSGCMDFYSDTFQTIAVDSAATFDIGTVGWTASGTHFSLLAKTTDGVQADGSPPTLSSLVWHYSLENEK